MVTHKIVSYYISNIRQKFSSTYYFMVIHNSMLLYFKDQTHIIFFNKLLHGKLYEFHSKFSNMKLHIFMKLIQSLIFQAHLLYFSLSSSICEKTQRDKSLGVQDQNFAVHFRWLDSLLFCLVNFGWCTNALVAKTKKSYD